MRVLISSIGSRGDVQPILALALELRALGHRPRLCVPPNFRSWIESFSIECLPIGPDVQQGSRRIARSSPTKPTKAQLRALASAMVRVYFRATREAAEGCDLIVVGGALQVAGRSIAELLGIPYVFAAYCPAALRAPDHPPAKMRSRIRSQRLPRLANRLLWQLDERSWNRIFRQTINEERAALGLAPVESVARHVSTDHPWLAADPVLGPAAVRREIRITQTGAWLLSDPNPLPDDLERFLAAGEPPIYFGFGSMQGSDRTGELLVSGARALGRRAIISQGWGQLAPLDAGPDCIAVGEVSHERLFPRVAAVVHHGGAGTTATAARAGRPQVIVPHLYDQFYWADRIGRLGIGVAGPRASRLDRASLRRALQRCLAPAITERARTLAAHIEPHGARIAAARLEREFSR